MFFVQYLCKDTHSRKWRLLTCCRNEPNNVVDIFSYFSPMVSYCKIVDFLTTRNTSAHKCSQHHDELLPNFILHILILLVSKYVFRVKSSFCQMIDLVLKLLLTASWKISILYKSILVCRLEYLAIEQHTGRRILVFDSWLDLIWT